MALKEAQSLTGDEWACLEVYTPHDALTHIEGIATAYRSQLLRGERIGNVAGLDILINLANYLKSQVSRHIDSPIR